MAKMNNMKLEKFIYKGGCLKAVADEKGNITSQPHKLVVKTFEHPNGSKITRICPENAIGILVKDFS